jgi:hypothetical protein
LLLESVDAYFESTLRSSDSFHDRDCPAETPVTALTRDTPRSY